MVDSFFITNLPFFVFVGFLFCFLLFKKENLEVQGLFPFFYIFLYKTQWGLRVMDIFSRFKNIRYFYFLSIFFGLVGSVFAFFFMIWNLRYVYLHHIESGGGLVLPLKTSSSFVYYVPFIYWIIAIFVLASVHELAHGIMARYVRVKIKSSGFAFLGILLPLLPAAFVEPDEEEMKKSDWKDQIAILGAGPTSNIIFGLFFLLIFVPVATLYSSHSYVSSVMFNGVTNESSLHGYNLSGDVEILSINNETSDEMLKLLFNLSLNKSYVMRIKSYTTNDTYTVIVKPYNSSGKGRLGINNVHVIRGFKGNPFEGYVLQFLVELLYYLWLLNLSIGLINFLPLWITDGGQITRVLFFKGFGKKKGNLFFNLISMVSLLILLLNIFPHVLF